jgi:hypothetical protein
MTVLSATQPLQSIAANPYTVDRARTEGNCGTGNGRREFGEADDVPPVCRPGGGGITGEIRVAVTTPTPQPCAASSNESRVPQQRG